MDDIFGFDVFGKSGSQPKPIVKTAPVAKPVSPGGKSTTASGTKQNAFGSQSPRTAAASTMRTTIHVGVEDRMKPKVGDTHPHNDCVPQKHRHEKAYVTSSAGGAITEGCAEHYYDRVVTEDEIGSQEEIPSEKYAEHFVMGEALCTPRFKRRYF